MIILGRWRWCETTAISIVPDKRWNIVAMSVISMMTADKDITHCSREFHISDKPPQQKDVKESRVQYSAIRYYAMPLSTMQYSEVQYRTDGS